MGSQEIIRRAVQSTGGKKQLEATLSTQAAIQASRLLTSGMFFGLMSRVQSSRGLGKHDMMTQGADGSFFLEPKLTMVISQCQDYGMCACVLRSQLLKAEQN